MKLFRNGLCSALAVFVLTSTHGLAQISAPTGGGGGSDSGRESPWLLTPLITAEPKLGNTIGGLGAYIKKFDEQSSDSMIAAFGTYSDTESWVAGFFGDLYFDQGRKKIRGAGGGDQQ